MPDSSAIFQRMKKGLCTNAYFSLTRQPLFWFIVLWYNLSMKNEKLTREQLNSLDKDILITLLLGMQDQIAQQTIAIEKLTEQIALMNTRTFGKKSEKLQIDEDQLSFFSEI